MKFWTLSLSLLLIVSCQKPTAIEEHFNCKSVSNYNNLKTVSDFRKNFTVELPQNWKKNLYFDDTQSSISTADTTLNLTKTTLLDISHIYGSVEFDASFKKKIISENKAMDLENITSTITTFKDKPAFINVAKGKVGNYSYMVLNIFAKIDVANFLQIKTEVYGDSLVENRFCKAQKIINKIQLN